MNRREFVLGAPSFALAVAAPSMSGCDSYKAPAPAIPRTVPALAPARSYDYNLCFVPAYGQSLSLGERGSPALSLTQRFDSLMFAGGLIAQAYSDDLSFVYGSLVPLVENDSLIGFSGATTGIANPGETTESGTFEAVKELMHTEDGLTPQNSSYRFLGSCPGRGAYMISQLTRGTVPYSRLLNEVSVAMSLAKKLGLSCGVPCVTWMQGEEDHASTSDAYLSKLLNLYDVLNQDILTITQQSKPIKLIMYQTAYFDCFEVAAAQYQATLSNPNIHIGTPCYPLQTDLAPWFDNIHLTNVSYKLLGAYLGSAYKRLIVNGEPWKPLSPARITATDKTITLVLNVYGNASVVADLQHTTTTCPIKPSLGFTLIDASGTLLNIDGQVSVANSTTLTIVSPQPIASGFILEYGQAIGQFAGGNIHDDYGKQYVFDGGGMNIPMHNWLTQFRFVFP